MFFLSDKARNISLIYKILTYLTRMIARIFAWILRLELVELNGLRSLLYFDDVVVSNVVDVIIDIVVDDGYVFTHVVFLLFAALLILLGFIEYQIFLVY